jgi:type VI secretion system protein ImpI
MSELMSELAVKTQNKLNQPLQIVLVVTNTQELKAGLSPSHTFTIEGGTIGASEADSWTLRDHAGHIHPGHASISLIDGNFCLTDLSGANYINGATMTVGKDRSARLSDNDMVKIGAYDIRIHFTDDGEMPSGNQHDLEKQFRRDYNALDIGSDEQVVPIQNKDDQTTCDPLLALDALEVDLARSAQVRNRETQAEITEQRTGFLLARDQHWQGHEVTAHADSNQEIGAAMVLKNTLTQEDQPMDDKILERLEEEMELNYQHQEQAGVSAPYSMSGEGNHRVAGPLLRGLGTHLDNAQDMAAMQALSEEIGASLQAAIRGLLTLHQQVSESRYGTMNKNLQPIEDNPLRLGLSYQETVQTMFDAQQSAVHLSAPSAIEESLRNVLHHNQVMQVAAGEALQQVLRAFSPDVLLRRFHAYRRPGQNTPESTDAWAWNMYKSYYRELTSNRQQGFEKLFWEVFDQAYDKALREKQTEQSGG